MKMAVWCKKGRGCGKRWSPGGMEVAKPPESVVKRQAAQQ